MKKSLLTIAAAAMTLSAAAATPTYSWHYLLDGPQGDMFSQVLATADGGIITYGAFGSRQESHEFLYDGEKIADGVVTTRNSDNNNLMLIKHNADGKKQWALYSKGGNFSVGDGSVTQAPDGNYIVVLKANCNQAAELGAPLIVDGTGAEITFDDWNTSDNIYQQIAVKVSNDGAVQWAKVFVMDQLPVPALSETSTAATINAVTPGAVAVTTDGTIWVGGNYRAPMLVTGAKNSAYILTPRNLEGYTNDVQKNAGGMYLIALDSDGNYAGHARVSGTTGRENVTALTANGDALYFAANIIGNANQTVTVAGKTATLENDLDGILLGCVKATGTGIKTVAADWLTVIKAYPASDGKHTTQLKGIACDNGSLYLYGLEKGGFGAPGSSEALCASTKTQLEGFILRADAATGTINAGVNNNASIGGYLGMVRMGADLAFYGYVLNAKTGTFLDVYADGDLSKAADRKSLVLGGGAPTGYSCAYNATAKTLYSLTRGNNVFTFAGSEEKSAKPAGWGAILTAHKVTDAGVDNVTANSTDVTFGTADGVITVSAPATTLVTIVNAAGQTVYSDTVSGSANIAVAPGLYLANNVKLLVK